MKRIFLILSLFAVMANLYATDAISVIRQKGWLETAMLQWTPVEGAAKYSVSYSGEGVSGNADDIAERVVAMYRDKTTLRRIGRQAREVALQRHNRDRIVADLLKAYSELVNR